MQWLQIYTPCRFYFLLTQNLHTTITIVTTAPQEDQRTQSLNICFVSIVVHNKGNNSVNFHALTLAVPYKGNNSVKIQVLLILLVLFIIR